MDRQDRTGGRGGGRDCLLAGDAVRLQHRVQQALRGYLEGSTRTKRNFHGDAAHGQASKLNYKITKLQISYDFWI